jgi:hypothetical protein
MFAGNMLRRILGITFSLAPLLLLFIASTSVAEAQTSTSFSLSWVRGQGAESCLSTQALAREIEKLFGRAMFISASEAEISIEASVVRKEETSEWYARVVVSNPKGSILGDRELKISAESCDAINEPLTIVIALIMDPECRNIQLPERLLNGGADVAQELLDEISSETVAQENQIATKKPISPKTKKTNTTPAKAALNGHSDEPNKPFRWSAAFYLDPVLSIGLLPKPGFGLGVGTTQFIGDIWPVELRGTYFFENAEDLASSAGQVRFYGMMATVGACPFTFDSFGQILLCAGFDAGGIFISGKNFSVQKSEFLVLGGELSGRLLIPVWKGIELNIGTALLFLWPRTFRYIAAGNEIGEPEKLYTMGPICGNLAAGIGYRF